MQKHYIQAVLELINAGKTPNEVLAGLHAVLKAKGHMRLHASVLRGVLRILASQKATLSAVVTVQKESDIATHKKAIESALAEISASKEFSTNIDSTIVGGFIAQFNNVVYDASYKSKLIALYRKVAK